MLPEEAVYWTPAAEQRLTGLEHRGEPAVGGDVGIQWILAFVDHPEQRLAAPGLAQVIPRRCAVHLFRGQPPRIDERLEEVEVISPAGIHHPHRRQDEVRAVARVVRIRRRELHSPARHPELQPRLPGGRLQRCLLYDFS